MITQQDIHDQLASIAQQRAQATAKLQQAQAQLENARKQLDALAGAEQLCRHWMTVSDERAKALVECEESERIAWEDRDWAPDAAELAQE